MADTYNVLFYSLWYFMTTWLMLWRHVFGFLLFIFHILKAIIWKRSPALKY